MIQYIYLIVLLKYLLLAFEYNAINKDIFIS